MINKRRVASVVALAGIAAVAAVGPAVADVIGNQFVQVGTTPQDQPSAFVAVSNGGTANSSGNCWPNSDVCLLGNTAAISTTGAANGGAVAASGTGDASGSAAVSGTGAATGSSTGLGAGISGADQANGRLVSVGMLGTQVSANGESVSDNTGDLNVPVTAAQAVDATWTPDPVKVAAKEEVLAQISISVGQEYAAGLTGTTSTGTRASTCNNNNYCPPPSSALTNLHEASQDTTYTCAPSSSRLVLWQMTGVDPGESQLAKDEHTEKGKGTIIKSIPPVLNSRQSSEYFDIGQPGDASHYLSMAASDVWYSNHPLINNVQTKFLSFWGGHDTLHYDVTYGYDSRGGTVSIFDEWDPTRFNISLQRYGNQNPYGRHPAEPVNNVVAAIKGNKGDVIW